MTLYNLYCERCDKRTTHVQADFNTEADPQPNEWVVEHPKTGTEVICRWCLRGYGKANLPDDGATFYATASVEQGLSIDVHPDFIEDGQSLQEYIEEQLKERRGEIAREIADGLRESKVELTGMPETQDMDGYPPR